MYTVELSVAARSTKAVSFSHLQYKNIGCARCISGISGYKALLEPEQCDERELADMDERTNGESSGDIAEKDRGRQQI